MNFEMHNSSGGGRLRLYLDGENHYGPSGVADGTWKHLAAVRDGNRVRMYINGVEVHDSATSKGTINIAREHNIGRGYAFFR